MVLDYSHSYCAGASVDWFIVIHSQSESHRFGVLQTVNGSTFTQYAPLDFKFNLKSKALFITSAIINMIFIVSVTAILRIIVMIISLNCVTHVTIVNQLVNT